MVRLCFTESKNNIERKEVNLFSELGEGVKGTIGIIGPKRMDYEHVMKTLKTLMTELDEIFHKEE